MRWESFDDSADSRSKHGMDRNGGRTRICRLDAQHIQGHVPANEHLQANNGTTKMMPPPWPTRLPSSAQQHTKITPRNAKHSGVAMVDQRSASNPEGNSTSGGGGGNMVNSGHGAGGPDSDLLATALRPEYWTREDVGLPVFGEEEHYWECFRATSNESRPGDMEADGQDQDFRVNLTGGQDQDLRVNLTG
ncbi:hypothetical protein DHEL01_v211182 [Diaporthe helianthi]|uniref:Uncharacterized protein n=1 Tax=Diaporthe helianthi TaxID=158607 RepID=A0A2P5HJI7_DIAHE|nr:hypothetical protein DHEL01_v211182 [Diaporthe helianthi]